MQNRSNLHSGNVEKQFHPAVNDSFAVVDGGLSGNSETEPDDIPWTSPLKPGEKVEPRKSPVITYEDLLKQKEAERNASAPIFPPVVNGADIKIENITVPKNVVWGLLSLSEKMELAGSAKSFKTWALIDLALSVACKEKWWGFMTSKMNVIYLNLELQQPYFEQRLLAVAEAKKLSIPSNFLVWHLRGQHLHELIRWGALLGQLKELTVQYPSPLLITDPVYKLLGGRNENAAGEVQMLMEQLEDAVQATKGCNAFGHHFAKGNQAGKEHMDRASGSSVFQRDPDTVMTMSKHGRENCFTIETTVRNHQPVDDFVVEWQYPLFVRNDELDPKELKQTNKGGRPSNYKPEQLAELLNGDELKTVAFQKRAREEIGITSTWFYKLLKEPETLKLVSKDTISGLWSRRLK